MRQDSNGARKRPLGCRFITAGAWVLAMSLQALGSTEAQAQTPTDLGTVQTLGSGPAAPNADAATVESAPYQAPTKTPLTVTQPTSVIDKQYIENNIPPTANFDRVVSIAPSVMVSPAGSGGYDAKIMIRGFQNGQFNTTLDGVPLQAFNLTQRSGTFVMTNDLGQVQVDRGPGTASTVGNATFGGTLALQTKAPLPGLTATPTVGYGSFNTQLYGGEIDSGAVSMLNGGSIFLDTEYTASDGFYTNAAENRGNYFLKWQQPVGDNSVLTLVSTFDEFTRNYFQGASKAQIAAFGPNFGLTSSSATQAFSGFNQWNLKTDFEYLAFKSEFGDGWHLDNRVYTYGYSDADGPLLLGKDPSGNTHNGTIFGANDVPGTENPVWYRSYGDVFTIQKDVSFGDLKTGIWGEYQPSYRALYNVDMSLNSAIVSTSYNQNMTLDTIAPYVEADWKLLPDVTLTTGVKYDYIKRGYDSAVDPNTHGPLNYTQTWQKALPSIALNFKPSPNSSVYAQVAEGFLAPTNGIPATSSIQPQTTWNYQAGGAWQDQRLTLSGDVYYIDFVNLIASQTVGGVTTDFNNGGAIYKGVEAEGTFYVAHGVSLYGNGSINSAKMKQTGFWLAEAPDATAAAGVIYNQDGWYASLIDKWVGARYGNVNQTQGLQPFNELDLSFSYKFSNPSSGLPPVIARFDITNLLDSEKIIDFAGFAGGSLTPLFYTQIGRSFFGSVSVPF